MGCRNPAPPRGEEPGRPRSQGLWREAIASRGHAPRAGRHVRDGPADVAGRRLRNDLSTQPNVTEQGCAMSVDPTDTPLRGFARALRRCHPATGHSWPSRPMDASLTSIGRPHANGPSQQEASAYGTSSKPPGWTRWAQSRTCALSATEIRRGVVRPKAVCPRYGKG